MNKSWNRLSESELQAMRLQIFKESPSMIDVEQIQRLLNERDVMEYTLKLSEDKNRLRSEMLTAFEIMSEQKHEIAALRERLSRYEQDTLIAAV